MEIRPSQLPADVSARSNLLAAWWSARTLVRVNLVAAIALTVCALTAHAQEVRPRGAAASSLAKRQEAPTATARKEDSEYEPYIVGPTDVLRVTARKLVPKNPSRIEPFDVLKIHVVRVLRDQPIDGPFPVDELGRVDLGPQYGKVSVKGLTADEATDSVTRHLKRILQDPEVSLNIIENDDYRLTGRYVVGPDGAIHLGRFGRLRVAGKTLEEAGYELERALSEIFDHPQFSTDIVEINSKAVYVVIQHAKGGDSVQRCPWTANQTLLDLFASVEGLRVKPNKSIEIVRPGESPQQEKRFEIKWDDLIRSGASASNLKLRPNDRVIVAEAAEEPPD